MQHHKLNFLICQDSWLMPFIIQSHPSERQEFFLHGCVWEGNLFPLSCSTGGGTDGSGQVVPAPGALQKDTSLTKSLTQDISVAVLRFVARIPTAAQWLVRSSCLGPHGADQSPLWLRHLGAAGQHWEANTFAAARYLKSLQMGAWCSH